jgi:ATP-binding cassette subfamily B protein
MAKDNYKYQRKPRGMRMAEKPKNTKKSIAFLLKEILQYKFRLIIVIASILISTVFFIISPKVLSKAINILFEGLVAKYKGTGGIDFEQIAIIIAFLFACYIISSIFTGIQGFIMAGITGRVGKDLRTKMRKKTENIPLSFFEKNKTGDVISKFTNDIDTLVQGLNQGLSQGLSNIMMVVGILIMMLSINVMMTLIILIVIPLSTFLMGIIMKVSQKHFSAQQKELGEINSQTEEMITRHFSIKTFTYEKTAKKDFNETNKKLYTASLRSQFLSGIMFPLMQFIGNLAYVFVALVGGVFAFNGVIMIGDIQAFIQYVRNFTMPIGQFAQIINQLQSSLAAAERINIFLEEKEEEDETADQLENVKGEISFKNVSFGYEEGKEVIHSFNLDISSGEKIAIVGPTGAGKTTIVKLLMRFYDVNSGEIIIDGKNIKDITRNSLRECFGMVLQDTWLFSGTIKENIAYGKENARDEEIVDAAKVAMADHFINTLPGGYDFLLTEEADNISAGQKQLLTIARAVLANKKILILDEATSNIDTETEERIQVAMDNLSEGKTSFIIAHRLSTIKNADKILVLNKGNIVEQGNHKELLSHGGFYATLYNSQFN